MINMLATRDILLSIVALILGILFILYQMISWTRFEYIRKLSIWWNKHVFQRHKEPYYGPSEAIEKLSHVYGIFIFLLGVFLVIFGLGILLVS